MSDLISRDALKRAAVTPSYYDLNIPDVLGLIDEQPTIEAEPVVRCRECNNTKWWPTPKDTIFCDKWGEWMPCNGFCHMGARKDGGADP